MIFFLDENFPKSATELLESKGHKVIDIRGTSDEGSSDERIFSLAQKNKAVFLTSDRDFFHTIPQLYDKHFGVVVFALRQPNRERLLERLEWFLDQFNDVLMENRVFQLRDRTYLLLTE
jgi:predicted nuclease of predicted toxin-antitoxin system